jgi:uncharacterized protein with HEPN domain
MNKDRRDRSILQKIARYCDDIAEYSERFGKSLEALKSDRAYKDAAAMCILQIGELAGHLSDGFKITHPEMPWRLMKSM